MVFGELSQSEKRNKPAAEAEGTQHGRQSWRVRGSPERLVNDGRTFSCRVGNV